MNKSQIITDKIATAIIDQLILGELDYKNENFRKGVVRSIRTMVVMAYVDSSEDIAKIPDSEIGKYIEEMIVKAKAYGRLLVEKIDEVSAKRPMKLVNSNSIKVFIDAVCETPDADFGFLCN